MNNEETIIAQPKGNEQSSPVQEKKNNKGRKIAATAATVAVGGVIGGVGTAAAMKYSSKAEEEEPQNSEEQEAQTEEAKVEEEPLVETKSETAQNTEEIYVVPDNGDSEPDYTNLGNADPVVTTDGQATVQVTAAVEDTQPEVQVLGIYEHVTDEGIHQTAAILTDGTEVAAVVDVNGDGRADVLAMDDNHDQQIDEGEIVDISDQNVHMTDYEQMYSEQQMEQQQMDDMAYNASNDNMPDYDNNGYTDA